MACRPFSFRRQPNGDRSAVIFSSWDGSRFSSPQSAVRTVTWWPRRPRPSESARTFTGGPPNSRKGAYVSVTFRIRIVRAGFFSVILQKLRNGIRIHALAPPRSHLLAKRGIGKEGFDGGGQLNRIAMRHQITGHSILNHLGCAALDASNNRFAARHGFEIYKPESLAAARQGEDFAR